MPTRHSRRRFLRRGAAFLGTAAGTMLFPGPFLLADPAPNSRLNLALIGCGGRGTLALSPQFPDGSLVALADPDESRPGAVIKHLSASAEKLKFKNWNPEKIQSFTDYRQMFDKIHKDIDAVAVATPDHQHACASMMAIKLGKAVYCEKPLTHHIYEARALAEAAKKYNVPTQMGNQGMGTGGDQALAEYIDAGAIGTIKEVHSWHGWLARFGGSWERPAPSPAPKNLHWDDWIGPAPFRDYHDKLHPGKWHGWRDFGGGSIGGWGTHILDAVFFALKLGYPISAETLEMEDLSDQRFPMLTTIRFDFAAAPTRPALKVFWYEGGRIKPKGDQAGEDTVAKGINRPKLCDELEKKFGAKFGGVGSIFVGEKGYIAIGSHGTAPRIIPEEQHKAFPVPERKLPRIAGGIWGQFIRAAKGDKTPCISNFTDFAGPFIESLYVAHLAMRAGLNKKLDWDGPNMKCTNLPELYQFVKRDYRPGWTL